MTRLKLSDLPADARARVEAQLAAGDRLPSPSRSRTKKSAPTAGVDVVCATCRAAGVETRLTSEAAMNRHMTESGHGRYEIPLDG